MVTKKSTFNNKVDWDKVDKATEVPRTYLVRDKEGREFFKMYKPSEAHKIFKQKGWRGKLVGILDKSRRNRKGDEHDARKNIRKNSYYDFMDHCRT